MTAAQGMRPPISGRPSAGRSTTASIAAAARRDLTSRRRPDGALGITIQDGLGAGGPPRSLARGVGGAFVVAGHDRAGASRVVGVAQPVPRGLLRALGHLVVHEGQLLAEARLADAVASEAREGRLPVGV